MNFLRLFRRRSFAGTNSPDGFIGDHCIRECLDTGRVGNSSKLLADDIQRLVGLPVTKCFAHAQARELTPVAEQRQICALQHRWTHPSRNGVQSALPEHSGSERPASIAPEISPVKAPAFSVLRFCAPS